MAKPILCLSTLWKRSVAVTLTNVAQVAAGEQAQWHP